MMNRINSCILVLILVAVTPQSGSASVLPNINSNPLTTPKLPANPWDYGAFDESFQDENTSQDSLSIQEVLTPSQDQRQVDQPVRSATSWVTDSTESTSITAPIEPSDDGSTDSPSGDVTKGQGFSQATDRGIPSLTEIVSFSKVVAILLVLLLVWIGTRFVSTVLTNFSERYQNYRLVIKRVIPIFKVTAWSVGLYFVIAGILQPPLETIITVSASVGIAVGFASQDILKNVFGGIMIILDKPFQVGDKIQVDDNYGEVTEIGLRSVRIVTDDDSVVTIPNAEIMNKSVSNSNSSALDCQVVAELYLDSKVDLNTVTDVCRKAALTSKYAYLNKPVYVHVTHGTLGPRDFMKVRLKAYVLDIRFEQELRTDMTNLAISELKRRGLIRN